MTILMKKFKNIRTQYSAGWSSGNTVGLYLACTLWMWPETCYSD